MKQVWLWVLLRHPANSTATVARTGPTEFRTHYESSIMLTNMRINKRAARLVNLPWK